MTQGELAEKLGMTTAELSQHERSAEDPAVWIVKDVAVLFETSAGDQLRDLALAVLDDAAERSRRGMIERGLGLRFALAYLWAYSAGSREPFDRYWRSLADPNEISRSQNVSAALNGIRIALRR